MKINDLLIVRGLNILEVSKIISKKIENGIYAYTLENGVKFQVEGNKFKVLNSRCSLEEFSEDRYLLLRAKKELPALIRQLDSIESLDDALYVKFYQKFKKLTSKYIQS